MICAQRIWFPGLFSGRYDNRYYERLILIGAARVKHIVDAHYMNRAVNIIKNACIGLTIGVVWLFIQDVMHLLIGDEVAAILDEREHDADHTHFSPVTL